MSHKLAKDLRHTLPAVLALANAALARATPAEPGGGDLRPGQIYALANASRFIETNFSEPLTTFATGWKDPNNIEATLEFFAPKTMVPGRLFEFKQAVNAEEFFTETDDIRAIGADFKRVEYTGTDATAKTLNKGVTMRVDLDNVNQNIPGWENRYIAKMLRRLMRNELLRAITLLTAAATNNDVTWGTSADPDTDVLTQLVDTATEVGFRANRVGYGDSAWLNRVLALRGNDNAAKFASNSMTPEQVAAFLQVDQVLVSKERYQSAAAEKSEVVGDMVFLFYAESGADTEDPSNIKRFVSPPPNVLPGGNQFARPSGGLDVNVYVQQVAAKLVDITVEHYSQITMTSTVGVNTLTVSS